LDQEKADIEYFEKMKHRTSLDNKALKELITDYNSRVGHNKSPTHKTVIKVKHHVKVH